MEKSDQLFSVKQLSTLAGVSVRTLHLYDKMKLLTPLQRTSSRYRLYGQEELLRLQQILFYKELDFELKEIKRIMDDPQFDILKALQSHREALLKKQERLRTLLHTIDNTINNLNNQNMNDYEKLYEGLPKAQAKAWRDEAIQKWGEDAVARSEKALGELSKIDLEKLKADQKDIAAKLRLLVDRDPLSPEVQEQIARHYANIRAFWGVSDPTDLHAQTYKGLGDLYRADGRYSAENGKPDLQFAAFMRTAMHHFADALLK